MRIFKITKQHIKDYPELQSYALGLYGLKISDDKEIMVYENKIVATKALAYFRSMFR